MTLVGIDSVMRPKADRIEAWNRLDQELDRSLLSTISHEIGLNEAIQAAQDLISGQVRGRVVVDVNR